MKNAIESIINLAKAMPRSRVFYIEDTGNNTYTKGTNWAKNAKPKFFDIYNISGASLTIEINNDGTIMTVDNAKSLGPISIEDIIETVDIVSTGNYRLMLRR